jgi:large subunit ribosomal protein L17
MMKRNLLTSLLLYESIRTTKKRAAVVAPQVDKLINYAKTHSPHVAIRYINKTVTDKNASKKIMEVFIKRYAKKSSGLTRTVPAGFRIGDGAKVVDLSLVEGEEVTTPVEQMKEAPKKKPTPVKQ